MIFGCLQKSSLIDYPGKVSCVLFLSGCNFRCPDCHNPQLIKGHLTCPTPLNEKTVFRLMKERMGLLDREVISGGEPTLFQVLPFLCERIKQMGYPVKLDTNGSRPRVTKELIDHGLIDYIAMDVKIAPFHYSPVTVKHFEPSDILTSIEIIMASSLDYEFRTTCVRAIIDRRVVAAIVKTIKGARTYALQRFHDRAVLYPEFFRNTRPFLNEEEP